MRFVAGAAAFALLAGGLGATVSAEAATTSHTNASTPRVTATVPPVNWGACPGYTDLQSVGAQCATIQVPLNPVKDPTGPTIPLEISMIQHTSSSSDYQGIILSNPGGPGGSGLDLNYYLTQALLYEGSVQKGAAAANDEASVADYDWIGFDPRGINTSTTTAGKPITCDANYFSPDRKSYDPTTSALKNYWLQRSKHYAYECTRKGAAQNQLLSNDTTIDSAYDMHAIMEALGQSQLSYYGFSYGTYLGQVYGSLFPSTVKRIILDSNIDPRTVWYQANLNQDVAFNRNINIWFKWLAKYNKIFHLGKTESAVSKRFYGEEAYLVKHPIKVGKKAVIGPDEWVDLFLEAGYYEQTWIGNSQEPGLAYAFADWMNKHNTAARNELVDLYESTDTPGNDNEFAGYVGVECSEGHWPGVKTELAENTKLNKHYPFETWGNAWFNAPCMYWPYKSTTPEKIDLKSVSSGLLIDETLDAATPFEGSEYIRSIFPNSVLLAEPGGTTHADSLDGDLCVDNTVANYLATGSLPARNPHAKWDKTCKPLLEGPVPPKNQPWKPSSSTNRKAGVVQRPLIDAEFLLAR
jgi:pimeloyl-ACP methyl ester carboxylesterase